MSLESSHYHHRVLWFNTRIWAIVVDLNWSEGRVLYYYSSAFHEPSERNTHTHTQYIYIGHSQHECNTFIIISINFVLVFLFIASSSKLILHSVLLSTYMIIYIAWIVADCTTSRTPSLKCMVWSIYRDGNLQNIAITKAIVSNTFSNESQTKPIHFH